ncbi:hypothetical protein MSG28_003112 [Choristoneura fumiferana]|uniref:Uncharacterized protein n=1 Tax=Choristoneura fumiferana TaxID=7141 RepID=A0ACC0KES1_CHOFU|nr:hypothetical protein MSG28_003112 [Choristoneura fumiferana]
MPSITRVPNNAVSPPKEDITDLENKHVSVGMYQETVPLIKVDKRSKWRRNWRCTHATLPNSSLGTSLSPAPVSDIFARKAATRAAISSFGNLRNHTKETLITNNHRIDANINIVQWTATCERYLRIDGENMI